ncbi:MAG: MerR family transcriptional regulator [Oscillospiraceae bacterium]|nr:MerR family transcriptional regulator [Oscillospiraceae bacterium]
MTDRFEVEHILYYKERISAVTGVPVHTLTLWDKQGILPFTPFRDAAGRKLYSQKHVDAVDEVLARELPETGIYDIDKEHLRETLLARFKQINASLAQKFKGAEVYETQKESKQRRGHRGRAKRPSTG